MTPRYHDFTEAMTAYAIEQARLFQLGWVQAQPETADNLFSFGFQPYGLDDPDWQLNWATSMGPLFSGALVYIMDDRMQPDLLRLRRIEALAADPDLTAALHAVWTSVPCPDPLRTLSGTQAADVEQRRRKAVEAYLNEIPGLRRRPLSRVSETAERLKR